MLRSRVEPSLPTGWLREPGGDLRAVGLGPGPFGVALAARLFDRGLCRTSLVATERHVRGPTPRRPHSRRDVSKETTVAMKRGSSDDADLVRLYLRDIGRYPLLTKDGEAQLAQAMEAGREAEMALADPGTKLTPAKKRELRRVQTAAAAAEQSFVSSNLRLVVSIAKRYQASGLPLLDLVQEGNLGLIHAVAKFDWRKGFKFSTYATWWIRQAITRGIANTGRTIRLPVHAGDMLSGVQKAQGHLESKLGRQPRPYRHTKPSGSRSIRRSEVAD